ncbi:MAG: hypothetical protein EBR82_77570, partial [Caulobacteraceae bacterium]|nr:hypothetical protein [Caulobacteraceae bacterium]
ATIAAGNDSLVDVPTNGAQTDTGVGGEVRGNYCTWNPLTGNTYSASYKNGNLDFDSSVGADGLHVFSTFQLPSTGKWYWETVYSQNSGFVGINSNATIGNNTQLSTMKTYYSNGDIGGTGGNATWGVGDVIGAAYDADAGTLKFYKNGSLQATTISSVGFSTGPWWAQLRQDRDCISSTNFGQRPFAYTAPSGFKALCTTNLPAPLVTKPCGLMLFVAMENSYLVMTPLPKPQHLALLWARLHLLSLTMHHR